MTTFDMPSLGADMDRGTVVEWLVRPGDEVKRGDIVVLVETDKGVIEVEIWEDARFEELLAPVGTVVEVGAPIARITALDREEARHRPPPEPGTAAPPAPPTPPAPPVRHLAKELGVDLAAVAGTGEGGAVTREDVRAAAEPVAPGVAGPEATGAVRISPRARRLAGDLGIDPGHIPGTGPGGVVTEADVRAAVSPEGTEEADVAQAAEPAVEAPEAKTDAGAPMRRAIAQIMARAKREIPHYYLGTGVDMSRALAWLDGRNAAAPIAGRILPAVLMLKAAALAVHEVPEMNGFWVDGAFRPSERVHPGVAVSLRSGGLVAPAIHDADRMPLEELMAALRDLVQRTRTGRLRSSEMSDPTITITNLGERGVEEVYGVIYHPQVALVGFGRVVERPWAENGLVGARPIVRVTLSADHRVSDGHRGGLYLAAVDRILQRPEEL